MLHVGAFQEVDIGAEMNAEEEWVRQGRESHREYVKELFIMYGTGASSTADCVEYTSGLSRFYFHLPLSPPFKNVHKSHFDLDHFLFSCPFFSFLSFISAM